jgi:GNAT superfamily N-acetyltransferase
MTAFQVRPLDSDSWPDFARLVERHNGIWGGCWCLSFHEEGVGRGRTVEENRSIKHARVREDRAHAALVYAGDGPEDCVGWCQFGPTEELPRIKHKRAYREGLDAGALPDWRITCFFVDRQYRRQGVAAAALDGALAEIARLGGGRGGGGGIVESYPEDVEGRKISSSFLHNGTVALFESRGFERVRRIGKDHWVVRRAV